MTNNAVTVLKITVMTVRVKRMSHLFIKKEGYMKRPMLAKNSDEKTDRSDSMDVNVILACDSSEAIMTPAMKHASSVDRSIHDAIFMTRIQYPRETAKKFS